jgi:hypothetical protein
MGLLDAIGRWVRGVRAQRRFSSYVTPALVEQILSSPAASAPDRLEIEFVLALVEDDDLGRLPELLGQAAGAIREAGGHVDGVSGSLLLATFGVFRRQEGSPPDEQRRGAVSKLHRRLGERARIVHGRAAALFGDLGDWERFRWSRCGSAIHRFSEMVRLLSSLSPGEVLEWSGVRGENDAPSEAP